MGRSRWSGPLVNLQLNKTFFLLILAIYEKYILAFYYALLNNLIKLESGAYSLSE